MKMEVTEINPLLEMASASTSTLFNENIDYNRLSRKKQLLIQTDQLKEK